MSPPAAQLPASLVPTVDALLSSGARWLRLSACLTDVERRVGERYLRAAYQAWLDIVFVHEGKPRLEGMNDAATLYAENPAFFAPAVDEGQLEPISVRSELLERAQFVDAQFAELWPGLEGGSIDVHCWGFQDTAVVRTFDGSYWDVGQRNGVVLSASRLESRAVAWSLRSRLWEGTGPRARPVSSTFRAHVEEAVSVDTILRAANVEVALKTPTVSWANYRLRGQDAFQYGDTGEEGLSLDWTNTWPEPIFDFLPYSRDEVVKVLRAEATVVIGVNYKT